MTVPVTEVAAIAWLTLKITLAATALGAAVGVPVGALVGVGARPARSVFRVLLYTLYSLPPILAGLVGYMLLSRAGPLGRLDLLFTPGAIVLVEAALAVPLIAGLTVAALADVPAPVREAVRASGADPLRAGWALVREARLGILAGLLVGFGRALAEVAGALLVGGNVRGETRTLGTAILLEVSRGQFGSALALGGVLLALAAIPVIALVRIQQAEGRHAT